MLRVGRLGVNVPCLYLLDEATNKIYMEKIIGVTVKEALRGDYGLDNGVYTTRAFTIMVSCGPCD